MDKRSSAQFASSVDPAMPKLPRALYASAGRRASVLLDREPTDPVAPARYAQNVSGAATLSVVGGTTLKPSDDRAADADVQVIRFGDDPATTTGSTKSGGGGVDANGVDYDSDIISDYIGHYGWWQFFWTFLLALFQVPSTFQIFAFVFQVRSHGCSALDARPVDLDANANYRSRARS